MYIIKSIVCKLPDESLVKGDLYYNDKFKEDGCGFTVPEGVNTIEIVVNFNEIIIRGILANFELFTSDEETKIYNCKKQDSQFEVELNSSIISSIMEHTSVDYPFLPLPEPKVKSNDFALKRSIPVFPEDFVPHENKKIFLNIFKDILSNSSTEASDIQVRFWRKYAYERMSEIMETARTTPYDMDSISRSPYLSIRILNEYNNVKYNWELVTSNFAIFNRDILNNPDLPWDPESLYSNRILPKGFYIYKGIKVPSDYSSDGSFGNDEEDNATMFTSDEVIRDYSSYLPTESQVEVEIQDIEDSLEMIKEEFPEYFEDASEKFLVSIRESIIEMIKSEGTFILDDFVFPSCHIETQNKELDLARLSYKKIEPVEPTEEDPYSVRNVIDFINNNDLSKYSSHHSYYKEVIGIDYFFVKNRDEYLKVLEDFVPKTYSDKVEKCVFFEPGDVIRFPLAFNFPRRSFASIVINSSKMSFEYFLENPDINFSLTELVRCLPAEYVVRNLLFYPDRLKLQSFHFNKRLKNQNFHEEMLKLDSSLMLSFTSRTDLDKDNYEIIYKYPMINWKLNLYKYIPQLTRFQVKEVLKEKKYVLPDFDKKDPFVDNFDFYSFDYIISPEGVRLFSNYSGKKIDFEEFDSKTVEEKKEAILKIVKTKKELIQLFSDIIPDSYISSNKKTKWFAPKSINYDRIFNSYVEEFGSSEGFFVFLKFFDRTSTRTYGAEVVLNNVRELFSLLIKQMYETTEDKSSVYEYFVKASLVIISLEVAIFNYGKFFPSYKFDYMMDISEMFTIEDVSNSQFTNYSYLFKQLGDIIKKIHE